VSTGSGPRRTVVRLGLLFLATALCCSRPSGKGPPPVTSRSPVGDPAINSNGAGGGPAIGVTTESSGRRHSVLGRVVNFGEMRATATLTDTPDAEITDPSTGTAVVLSVDSSLAGYRLSSGQAVWTGKGDGPCRHLALAGRHVYSACGDALYSFASESGERHIVDAGPDVRDPIVVDGGAGIASVHGDGRVSIYDSGNEHKVASRLLPEIARAMHPRVVATAGGVCAIGLGKRSGRLSYHAGCYDRGLEPRWTKWLPLKLTPDVQFGVAQLGPRYLVLDDQESVLDPSLPAGPGDGWVLRWTDGELTPSQHGTFATIESPNGTRLTPSPDIFSQTVRLDSVASNGAGFQRREAQVVSAGGRAYALVVNHAAGLAGVDTSTGQTLFLVPLRLGETWSLEVADGYPVVRTRFRNSWIATIHDPTSGTIVYRDERPRTPGR